MHRATVLIAEDNFIIIEGALRPILEQDFAVVGTAGDGFEAIAAANEHRPDVVLVDVSLPGLRGFEVARSILASQPDCKVIFVSNYADRGYVEAAQNMRANGYVLKSSVATELATAIRTALSGNFYRPSFLDLPTSASPQKG